MADDAVCQLRYIGLLLVAGKAPSHIHRQHGLIYRHVSYVAVAVLTIPAGGDVDLMAEKDKAGKLVDANPGDGFLTRPIAGYLLDHRQVS